MDLFTILLIVGIIYTILSIVFFLFPFRNEKNPVRIPHEDCPYILGGHRGCTEERLENTLSAFKYSASMGMHVLELDVHSTKDKQVVVHHDKCLKRLCGVEKLVSEVEFSNIPKCLNIVPLPYLNGTYELKASDDDGKIPLLRELFEQNLTMPMNIDLKGGDEYQLDQILDMIVEFKRENITYIGDMNEKKNRMTQAKAQKIGIGSWASILYVLYITIAYFFGLLPFINFRYNSIWFPFLNSAQIGSPNGNIFFNTFIKMLINYIRFITYFMKPMFWHLRKRGILIMFWVVNTEEEIEKAIQYPIDGILTDCPKKIRRIIDSVITKQKTE